MFTLVIAIAAVIGRASLERLNATQSSSAVSRPLTVRHDPRANTISIYQGSGRTPIAVEHAGAQARPTFTRSSLLTARP